MNTQEKLDLITRNLQEVLGMEKLQKILAERDVNIYWGTATTGRPHIGYFVPMVKIADFLRAGCHVTILFADLHAYLDNMKAPWSLLKLRTEYYEHLIKGLLTSIGVPLEKLKFIRGTDFQLSKEYILEIFRMASMVTEHDAKKAGAEVVKQVETPLLSSLLYPGMQALDEEFLKVDAQFGGVDQRKIFTFAEKYIPALGYEKRIHLMNPMVSGLTGTKMSSSEPDSKIDLLDEPKAVEMKIKKAFCEEGNIERNGILPFIRHVLFPIFEIKKIDQFTIERLEKYGGNVSFSNFETLEKAFAQREIFPLDLKIAVSKYLNQLLDPIRNIFKADCKLTELLHAAYPNDFISESMSNLNIKNNENNVQVNSNTNDISKLLIKVGKIIEISRHPNADTLYIERVDFNEPEGPRTILSGLVHHLSADELVNRNCLFFCNLKPATIRGIESNGMIMAAEKDGKVELVLPHQDSKPGDIVHVASFDGMAAKEIDGKKKDAILMTSIFKDLKVNSKGVAEFRGIPLMTENGPCCTATLKDCPIH